MVFYHSDTKSLNKVVIQKVILKDWSEKKKSIERLSNLFEVTQ